MEKYDPDHRVGLIVDEWGAWYDVEPGTNPGFLYQQNTMRDAVLAAITLDIFNAHADRVVMANLAQTVNVLQSVILTEGDKIVLTPTYHVFDLYKAHQDAAALGFWLENGEACAGGASAPLLSATASHKDEVINVTLTNLSAAESVEMECEIGGLGSPIKIGNVGARMLTGAINAKNDFDNPHSVIIKGLDGIEAEGTTLRFSLPACCVAAISIAV
jgi:alpha-N-arabinofuranosidase